MDPHTGKLYPSVEAARADGVRKPIGLHATPEQARRISSLVAKQNARDKREKQLKKKAKKKKAKASRKRNRD